MTTRLARLRAGIARYGSLRGKLDDAVAMNELLEQGERDDAVAKLKVVTVLESLPGVGKVRARRIMEEVDISESRRVRGLGGNQRDALLKKFPSA